MCQERNTGTNLPAQIDLYAAGRRPIPLPLHRQGGRLLQQDGPLPKDQGPAQRRGAGESFSASRSAGVGRRRLPTLPPGPGGRRHQPRVQFEGAETGHRRRAGLSAGNGRRQRRTLSRRPLGRASPGDCGRERFGRPVRRPLPGPGRPGGPRRAPRRQLPTVAGGFLQCPSQRAWAASAPTASSWKNSIATPARFLPKALAGARPAGRPAARRRIDLDQPMDEIRRQLGRCPVGTLVLLSGTLVLARDLAHARFHELLKSGRPLPEYLSQHVICYAGPAETPPGRMIGSFGPTTAERMDDYLPELMARGASLVTVAKGGPRGDRWSPACRARGGFYLGAIGGAAAWLAKEHVAGVGGDRLRRPGHGGRTPHQGQGPARLRRHRRQGKRPVRSSGVRADARCFGKPKCPLIPIFSKPPLPINENCKSSKLSKTDPRHFSARRVYEIDTVSVYRNGIRIFRPRMLDAAQSSTRVATCRCIDCKYCAASKYRNTTPIRPAAAGCSLDRRQRAADAEGVRRCPPAAMRQTGGSPAARRLLARKFRFQGTFS